ncbi:MAG: hypothetical protein CK425_06150 [Parachlamydia sp.]|nr:MAG: hypothetical protein CK425_06150 [Parachlamydia sp.]
MHWKPYFYIFKAYLMKDMSYRFNFLFSYILHMTRLLIYLAVWATIFVDKETIHHYTWDEMASYYVLITISTLLLAPSHLFEFQPLIRKGSLSTLLIKPIHIEANIFAKFLASKLPILLLMSTLSLLVLYLLNISFTLSLSPWSVLLFGLSFLLIFYFGLALSVLAFWLVEMWPLRKIFQGCMTLFGGIVAPLDLFPRSMQILAGFTPFPYFGYINVKALQGELTAQELQGHCLIAISWIVFFICVFKFLWKQGLKHYEAVNL